MRHLIIISVLTLMCIQTNAQRKKDRNRNSVSFGAQVEIPVGEFQDVHGEATFGYGGSFLRSSNLPFIQSGINFTYGQSGRYTDDVSVLIGETINGFPVYDMADVTAKHKVYRSHGVLRFRPFRGSVQPYIEGVAGFKMYSSSVKMEQGRGRSSVVLDHYNLERSFTTSYGVTAGLKIQVSKGFFIEGKYEHMTGGRAEYIDSDSFFMNSDNQFEYDIQESLTNSSMIHLGISLDF